MRKVLVIILASSVPMFVFADERVVSGTADREVSSSIDGLNMKAPQKVLLKEAIGKNVKSSQTTESRGYADGEWTYWHDNGQIKSQGHFIDNKWSGKWVSWYPNGEKKSEGLYVDGVQEGLWAYWHDNGVKQSEGRYIKGKKNGHWIFWYRNGQKKSEGNYN